MTDTLVIKTSGVEIGRAELPRSSDIVSILTPPREIILELDATKLTRVITQILRDGYAVKLTKE